jgi:folate-dependent phosphoribosylglycinamide formyltransferase PurN
MGESTLMKTFLICHEGALLDQEGLARWLASFSELVGVVILREKGGRKFKRIKREIKRSGVLRFLDVTAFRVYYKLFLSAKDSEWERKKLEELKSVYTQIKDVPILITHSPNSDEAEQFIKRQQPDIIIARCKVILNKRIFSLAKTGTFVMHPGICPEYRNAHGCFWALAHGDFDKVGMTLLKIDEGVDTGPIYGYYSYDYDSLNESHIRIQSRVVLDNLKSLEEKLKEIHEGRAGRIDVKGRESHAWGHPWMTRYAAWKRRAKREGK